MELEGFITINYPNYERLPMIGKTRAFQLITENHPSSFLADDGELIELSEDNVKIVVEQTTEFESDEEVRSLVKEIEQHFPLLKIKPARMSATLFHCGAVSWMGISVGVAPTLEYWWRVDETQETDLTSGPMWD